MRKQMLWSGMLMVVLALLVLAGRHADADTPTNFNTKPSSEMMEMMSTATARVELEVSTATSPDFDGDGMVGISDFLLFVNHFGTSSGDAGYDARYDLDGNGAIGISDFLIFVNSFGSQVPPSGGSGGGSSGSPDLIVESPSVSNNTLTTGQSFTLSATVRNEGTGSSASTTLRYYRSSNSTISTSDTQVGTDSVNGLLASGTSAESINLNAPSSAGTYYYGTCIESVSSESNTDNNCSDGVSVTVSSSSGGGGGGGEDVTFRDDFNSSGSLSDWEFFSARASVSEGVLRLTNTRTDRTARAVRSLGAVITEWEVRVRMGSEKQTAGHNAAVVLRPDDSRYSAILFEVGSLGGFEEHTNYHLEIYDHHKSTWVTVSSGQSNAINEGAGQFTEIELQLKAGIMRAMAGDTTLYEDNVLDTFPTAIERVELWARHPLFQTTGSTALFDWVKVSGTPTGGGSGSSGGGSLGACRGGLVVNPGESCTYKDDYTFSVSSSGTGNIIGGGLFMSAGNSFNERGTVNGVRWNFVASKNSGSNSWTIHTAE